MARVTKYRVSIHVEGLNDDEDTLEGDEYHEPRELLVTKKLTDAEMFIAYILLQTDRYDG